MNITMGKILFYDLLRSKQAGMYECARGGGQLQETFLQMNPDRGHNQTGACDERHPCFL